MLPHKRKQSLAKNLQMTPVASSDMGEEPSTAYLLLEGEQTFGPQRSQKQNKEEQTKSM